jgi:heme oxygenase
LGGQLIGRHIERQLQVTPLLGGRFFHGRGADTGSRWRAFRESLDAQCRTREHQDAVVDAAIDTFKTLRHWCVETPGDHPLVLPRVA